ncbi:threonine dehydratase [Micromonospora nigra]|uniref:threonine ammonia-lyase n=1 Tax=Micromonospora nigra TaxID=145857 RepID=A0A1C6RTD7_9ACTN|nr:threonine/serine dehydratase [Micromonospora nigra]SCL20328.1 threonine dehydratase [Micromonospora nigra]
MVTRSDVEAAAKLVAGRVRQTPVLCVDGRDLGVSGELALKLELHQHTGSFKPRGAFNRLLQSPLPAAGVLAASGGNHGLAVAYAARELGVPAEIFVPVTSSPVKVERLAGLDAQVRQVGEHYAEAFAASTRRAEETGALVVHAYDQQEVVAGQGTLARELERQLDRIDTVLVAVGGGGLVGGIASWFDGAVGVVGVEPEGIPTLHAALAAGRPVDVEVGGVATDSLGARRIGDLAFEAATRTGVRSVLVPDEDVVRARRLLWSELRIAAELGGATALAALLTGAYVPRQGERVVVVVCGGNTDPSDLAPHRVR